MKSILTFLMAIIISTLTFTAENTLSKYVSDETYNKGIEKFPKNIDIFKSKVYSLNAIKKELEDARNKIRAVFKEVTFIIKQGDKWVSTFYYIDEKGVNKRKTVVEREKIVIGDNEYVIIPYEKGIKVTDLKTKVELSIEKKGR